MSQSAHQHLDRLLSIMAHLRDPERGCDWDKVQTFETIAPYTIEEAYEVADAIARRDIAGLRDELGDLLLQVVFHARMAEEVGAFDFESVAQAVADKLEARHPHLFGDDDGARTQTERWEAIKASERAAKGATSALDGVAVALPALMRAEKLQKRAARVGFDWPDPEGAAKKVREEMAELDAAGDTDRLEEAGDLLFAAVNFVRLHRIAPEDALRAANAKFERRFKAMEQLAADRGTDFAALDLQAQEALWQAVKASERGKAS
ncbi:nucleoside triphosphate pyrophosphohydrolase [Novosphingobium sp. PC22D]|uniref:nucleoside triphosphate pyrophosphohydrolase n=1 Tax=Novosphingobium sp. PC22D TaxID=1962403 RepID=UPI000BF0800C|nr:nucleoside triphosphate pyrophosphohydrolase [Novosphingobium sp. PC22D]PEQ11271.1 nucleoside triphosphate pyrophosphohydrolase [Novosphingobium sp. PC22D]